MDEVELFPGYVAKAGIGTLPRAELLNYTGLEMLQRMIDGHYPAPAISQRMNFVLTEASEAGRYFVGCPVRATSIRLVRSMAAGLRPFSIPRLAAACTRRSPRARVMRPSNSM